MVFNVVGMLAKLIFMFSQAQDFSSVFVFCFCISYGSFTLCNALYVNFEVLEKFAKNKMQMRKDEAEGAGTRQKEQARLLWTASGAQGGLVAEPMVVVRLEHGVRLCRRKA